MPKTSERLMEERRALLERIDNEIREAKAREREAVRAADKKRKEEIGRIAVRMVGDMTAGEFEAMLGGALERRSIERAAADHE
jgi:hypothetical protein